MFRRILKVMVRLTTTPRMARVTTEGRKMWQAMSAIEESSKAVVSTFTVIHTGTLFRSVVRQPLLVTFSGSSPSLVHHCRG